MLTLQLGGQPLLTLASALGRFPSCALLTSPPTATPPLPYRTLAMPTLQHRHLPKCDSAGGLQALVSCAAGVFAVAAAGAMAACLGIHTLTCFHPAFVLQPLPLIRAAAWRQALCALRGWHRQMCNRGCRHR